MRTQHTMHWKRKGAGCALAVVGIASAGLAGNSSVLEQAKLLASDGMAFDNFGERVAASGNTVVIGMPNDDFIGGVDQGSAHVYASTPTGWVEQDILTLPNYVNREEFGNGVAIDGDTLAVGATRADSATVSSCGTVTVFVRTGTSWSFQATLSASDANTSALFGGDVALEGDTLIVGAVGADGVVAGTGAAYVFERVGTSWSETAKLQKAVGEISDNFGADVALSGATVLVGDSSDTLNGIRPGSATVFERSGSLWVEGPTLFAPVAKDGQQFGWQLAIDGDTAVIGAWREDTLLGNDAGAAYVFDRSGASWSHTTTLQGAGVTRQEWFGRAVAIEGDRIAVGSPHDEVPNGFQFGSVYIFERDGGTWGPPERLAPTGVGPTRFGDAVDLSGDVLAAGAPADDDLGQVAGATYIYRWALPPETYCTAGATASGCVSSISAIGSPSASAASGFFLNVTEVEGNKRGHFFWGFRGRQANAWYGGTSFQCVVPPVARGPLLVAVGAQGGCDGAYSFDLNARWATKPAQNPGAGATVQAQFWFRDPFNPSTAKTSLSDAVEFLVCP